MSGFLHTEIIGMEMAPSHFLREIFFVSGKPGPVLMVTRLIEVLTVHVWIGVLCSILAAVVTLLLITFYSPKEQSLALFDSVVLSVGILINESIPDKLINPFRVSSKHVFLWFWCLCSLLLSMSYQSILLASLTKVTLEQPLDTFQQAIDQEIPLFILNGTEAPYLLRESPFPVVRDAYWKNVVAMQAYFSNDATGGSSPMDILRYSHELNSSKIKLT